MSDLITQATCLSASSRPAVRGRPRDLQLIPLAAAIVWCVWQGWTVQRQVWRLLVRGFASFEGLSICDQTFYTTVAQQGEQAMQALFEQVSAWLRQQLSCVQDSRLAPFAQEVYALDESTLDQVKRWLSKDRQKAKGESSLLAGRICGLFDVRRHQWARLDILKEPMGNCKVHAREMLTAVPAGTLLLFDLGYYAFEWFDDLTKQGLWWISRQRQGGSVKPLHIICQMEGLRDELVRIGAYRSDHAEKIARLISIWYQGKWYVYLTNVLDPRQLSAGDVTRLYARRWDIEMAFRALKQYLKLGMLWSAKPEVVRVQIWACAILAQLVSSWQVRLAWQEGVELGEVSFVLLLEQGRACNDQGKDLFEEVHEMGRLLGILRPSTRRVWKVPQEPQQGLAWPPPDEVWNVEPARFAHKEAGNIERKKKAEQKVARRGGSEEKQESQKKEKARQEKVKSSCQKTSKKGGISP